MKTGPKQLYIELEDGHRYLANRTDVAITCIRYSTWCIYYNTPDSGDVTVSRIPTYELRDIPPMSKVYLEDTDPYEDGHIYFQADEVRWADDRFEEHVDLVERRRKTLTGALWLDARVKAIQTGDENAMQDPEPALETVDRKKVLVHETPSRTRYADPSDD